MNKMSPYAHLLPKDFDKYNCVKLPLGFYLILAFILRGYLAWIMSVTNLKDSVGFLTWIYPEKSFFYASLFSGFMGWFIVLVISMRRPGAPQWVKLSWSRCHWVLLGVLIFDFSCTLWGIVVAHQVMLSTLIIHAAIVAISIFYIMKNQRFKLNLQEFPEYF